MKKTVISLIIVFACFSVGLYAQTEEPASQIEFKPRYAGTSLDMGVMFMPKFGSAFYVAPKFRFQATPRLFVNTGIGVVQYNMLPSQTRLFEGSGGASQQRNAAATGAYVFAEGAYLLTERWTVNGSMMKNVTPEPVRRMTPYRIPSEAMHIGVDFKVTPNISVGARVGYTSN